MIEVKVRSRSTLVRLLDAAAYGEVSAELSRDALRELLGRQPRGGGSLNRVELAFLVE